MLIFSTVLSINEKMTPKAFQRLIVKWNDEQSFAVNRIDGLCMPLEPNKRYGSNDLWLEMREIAEKTKIGIRYSKREDGGIFWVTDYCVDFASRKIAIHLNRSYSEDALERGQRYSSPRFVSHLIEAGYLADDNDLPVLHTPREVSDSNLNMFFHTLRNTARYCLPIVYVSRLKQNFLPVNSDYLARSLKGVAHVFTQCDLETEPFSCGASDLQLASDGSIDVYYPTGKCLHEVFSDKQFNYGDKKSPNSNYDLCNRVIDSIRLRCVLQETDPTLSWNGICIECLMEDLHIKDDRNKRLASENSQLKDNNKKVEIEKVQLASASEEEKKRIKEQALADANAKYETDISDFLDYVQKLEKEVEDKNRENAMLQSRLSSERCALLAYGNEKELFTDEIKDMLLLVLSECLKSTSPETRRYHILSDIIESNNYQKLILKKVNELQSFIIGYRHADEIIPKLESMGFVVTANGRHPKLKYYDDDRYCYIISSTPSDSNVGRTSFNGIKKLIY